MCVCTITPQQMELDLAHTLKTPTHPASSDNLFVPTKEQFTAAIEVMLRDGYWFNEMVERITTEFAESAIGEEIDDNLRRYFRNFDISDHVDMDREIESALSNYDFDDHISTYMDNNFDPEDYVDNAVTYYMDKRVDVEEVAASQVHDILNDADFIESLAEAIIKIRKQQAAERKAKREQQQLDATSTNQGDSNANL